MPVSIWQSTWKPIGMQLTTSLDPRDFSAHSHLSATLPFICIPSKNHSKVRHINLCQILCCLEVLYRTQNLARCSRMKLTNRCTTLDQWAFPLSIQDMWSFNNKKSFHIPINRFLTSTLCSWSLLLIGNLIPLHYFWVLGDLHMTTWSINKDISRTVFLPKRTLIA